MDTVHHCESSWAHQLPGQHPLGGPRDTPSLDHQLVVRGRDQSEKEAWPAATVSSVVAPQFICNSCDLVSTIRPGDGFPPAISEVSGTESKLIYESDSVREGQRCGMSRWIVLGFKLFIAPLEGADGCCHATTSPLAQRSILMLSVSDYTPMGPVDAPERMLSSLQHVVS